MTIWIRYAQFEETQKEFERSVAVKVVLNHIIDMFTELDPFSNVHWIQNIEMLKFGNVMQRWKCVTKTLLTQGMCGIVQSYCYRENLHYGHLCSFPLLFD